MRVFIYAALNGAVLVGFGFTPCQHGGNAHPNFLFVVRPALLMGFFTLLYCYSSQSILVSWSNKTQRNSFHEAGLEDSLSYTWKSREITNDVRMTYTASAQFSFAHIRSILRFPRLIIEAHVEGCTCTS
jgi:hypothetical protein